ncbi:helix-turn-helix domain-containing protein [Saccharothrix sp. NRRL B-16314]|uniref:helix-turn-helix domain-containing protein n=1 Tax=Saccharothrix sp. NRRL B-16314 TaxID=1463825 RepID=UPI0005243495|nr:helix-turn-helix transcriptional regulator [Saccharothrix sp. NRRL B-16314]
MTSRFGALVRQWRQRAGLSQEELAARADVGERTVRGLETGKRDNPQVRTVRMLADALRLSGAERSELFIAAGHAGNVDDAPASEPVRRGGAHGRSRRGPAVTRDPLVEATDALAHAVHSRWQREEEQQQVHDPVPLPVRWRRAPAALEDSWANILVAKPGVPARPLDLGGGLDQVVEVYRRIPSCRLVVLGRAGAGKTILTTRFVLDLLAAREPADPVPVIFGLGSWNPERTGLRDWLAERLVRDHPGLAAPGPGGSTLAAALVDTHRVLPVLDGFDEIAGGLHRAALAALNSTTLPLLLTSRVDEYRAAVDATGVLRAAGAVELVDLTADDLADYLPRTTRKTSGTANVWQPVLDEVRARPDGALAAVLTTPLMVALARRIYSDTPDHDPRQLLDTELLGDEESIERHLLGGFVPAVYQGQRGVRVHDVDQVGRWLGHLADHLSRLGTHDLAWWQLGTSMSRRMRALVVALFVFAGVWLGDVVFEGLLFGGSAMRVLGLGAVVGLIVGVPFGLVHGHLARVQPLKPVRFRFRFRQGTRPRAMWPQVRRRARMGLLFGALVGFTYGLLTILAKWLVRGHITPAMILVDVGVFTVVFASGAALAFGLIAAAESPQDLRSAASPADLLDANRKTVLAQVALFAPLFAVFFSATTWLIATALMSLPGGGPFEVVVAWPTVAGLALGVVGGFGGAFGYLISMTAWGQWVVFARVWLPLTGRLPWAVHVFLDDAYRRGVLRRAGAVYQFRHARLQDHLMETYRARS